MVPKFFVLFLFVASSWASPRFNLIPDGDGKFHVVDIKPVNDVEPKFVPDEDIRFMLHTRLNPTVGQQITWTTESILNSNFNPAHPVRLLVHGFNSGLHSGLNINPTRSWMELGEFNVIQVDWSIGANTPNYITARNRVPLVADTIARFLNFLVSSGTISSMEQVSIAGHSLGAHIAGITGKRVQESQRKLNVIWGLDPGGPLFTYEDTAGRLDFDDAIYTEGIRTNIGQSGFTLPICHADFYPHGGGTQPGCGIDISGSCSHSRAHTLFAETIISDRFVARRCLSFEEARDENCTGEERAASMGGEPGNVGLRGIFHLRTNGASPFAMG